MTGAEGYTPSSSDVRHALLRAEKLATKLTRVPDCIRGPPCHTWPTNNSAVPTGGLITTDSEPAT
eukprot:4697450-Prymnesium_polylepis.1